MSYSSQLSPAIRPRVRSRAQVSRGCGVVFFCIMILLAAAWGSGLGAFVFMLERARTQIAALETYRPKVGSRVYANRGEYLGEYSLAAQELINLNEIPLDLQKAFLASEDHLFYEHKGVRPLAALSAIRDTLQSGRRLRGFSTITMQLVRNAEEATQVSRERTPNRKLQESLVALQVEREFTKDEILELYLNLLFLGGSAKGVEAASRQYFGKSCRDLTLSESALLASLAPSPNAYRPDRYPERSVQRRNTVLGLMYEREFVTETEYEQALAASLSDMLVAPGEQTEALSAGDGYWGPNQFYAWYFVEEARKRMMSAESERSINFNELYEAGLEIYTTLDMRLQKAAEDTLLAALDEFDAKKLDSLQSAGREKEFTPVLGALVCIDNRPGHEGKVRALVGGRDSDSQKFNAATQAVRQPGSSVKPFVWAAALDMGRTSGLTAASRIVDGPFVRMGGDGKPWAPKNFDGKFRGPMTLRNALEDSVNIVSIKLVDRPEIGMPLVRSYLQSAGFPRDIPEYVGLTIGLGTNEVTVLEQCVAYSTFAKGGRYAPPTFVEKIVDRDGNIMFETEIKTEQRIPEDLAYVITYLLEGVTTRGTGARSAPLDRPRAGKTGTTNEARDVWFCGYTPDYTCVVWLGYKDNRTLGRGNDFTGGRLAVPIWTEFMLKAHEGLPVRDFTKPDSVKAYDVDINSGLLGGSFPEMFLEGTAPPTQLPIYLEKQVNEEMMEQELLGISIGTPTVTDPGAPPPALTPPSDSVPPPAVTPAPSTDPPRVQTTPPQQEQQPKRRWRNLFRRDGA